MLTHKLALQVNKNTCKTVCLMCWKATKYIIWGKSQWNTVSVLTLGFFIWNTDSCSLYFFSWSCGRAAHLSCSSSPWQSFCRCFCFQRQNNSEYLRITHHAHSPPTPSVNLANSIHYIRVGHTAKNSGHFVSVRGKELLIQCGGGESWFGVGEGRVDSKSGKVWGRGALYSVLIHCWFRVDSVCVSGRQGLVQYWFSTDSVLIQSWLDHCGGEVSCCSVSAAVGIHVWNGL